MRIGTWPPATRRNGPGLGLTRLEARVTSLRGMPRLALAAACGAALALAQAPVSLPVVLFLVLPLLLWLMDGTAGTRDGFVLGWTAGTGFFAATLFWIVEPFFVDAARHGWMAPFALVFMAGGLALFWGTGFALARAVWPRGAGRVLVLAAAWTLAEFARSRLFGGFPWALPAYAWTETPVIQGVALMGPHGLGFLTLFAGMVPGVRLWRPGAGAGLAVLIVAAGWAAGALRLATPLPERDPALVVRLVQPNAAQALKWDPAMEAEFYRRHLALSRAPAAVAPDVTIWSETAVPFVLGYSPDLQAEIADAAGGRLVLGIRRAEPRGEDFDWFNALAVLGPGGQVLASYDKHHLVPFGEFIPLAGRLRGLDLPVVGTLTSIGFSSGSGPHLVAAAGLPPFLPLICYEAIFPHRLRAPEGRPEWLVQVTNDGWFGTASGPYQHFAQARVRAVEQGLPLARVANTGISAMIDPLGRVTARLPLGAEGFVDAELPAALQITAYARLGDLPWVSLVLIIYVLTVVYLRSGISAPSTR